jgi:hypothetical protein
MKELSKSKYYNTGHAYSVYVDQHGSNLSFDEFKAIVDLYYTELLDYAYRTGEKVNLPCMGVTIGITSFKPKIKIDENGNRTLHAKTDWIASHKYWNEHPNEPRKVIKFVNMHTAMETYRWNIYRQKAITTKYLCYNTKFIENGSSMIYNKIKNGIFPVKINPKYEVRYNKKDL